MRALTLSVVLCVGHMVLGSVVQAQDNNDESPALEEEPQGFGLTTGRGAAGNKSSGSKKPSGTKSQSNGRSRAAVGNSRGVGESGSRTKAMSGKTRESSSTTAFQTKSSGGNKFGVGMELGYEARYGNAVALHYIFSDLIDVHAGLGYNLTGPKFGAGADVLFAFGGSFGVLAGGALVFSAGRKGEATLEAKFTDENNQSSTLNATKEYTVSAAQYLNLSAGAFWKVSQNMRLLGIIGYNLVIGGNNVSFTNNEIKYDKDVEVLNQKSADEDFKKKAEEDVKSGGLGGALGLVIAL